MAQITPQMVKELREQTGAGMADCKKALAENDGNMEAAVDFLRKKGAASAAKRADRDTNEGMIVTKVTEDGKNAVFVEVTCETDFVARNQEFVDFVTSLSDVVLDKSPANAEELMAIETNGTTVQNMYNDILAKFSEKIDIGRFEKLSTEGSFTEYVHAGSKLAVLVEMSNAISSESNPLVKDIAMQIAAMNPQFKDRSEVSTDVLDKEKEIYTQQAIDEGKPAEIASKIAEGRVGKFYKENCLVEQIFVKDSKKTVNDVLKDISNINGSEITINKFNRITIGG